ncbi:MAG: hypothetical protein ABI690_30765 [Chloroflexota bacterium]
MSKLNTPDTKVKRQGFKDIFDYFDQLQGEERITKENWDKKFGISYETLKKHYSGNRPTNPADCVNSRPVAKLAKTLIQKKILRPERKEEFVKDLCSGNSVKGYFPPNTQIPQPKVPILLKNEAYLVALQQHFPVQYVGYKDKQDEIKTVLREQYRAVLFGLPGAGKTSIAAHIVEDFLKHHVGSKKHVLWMETGSAGTKYVTSNMQLVVNKEMKQKSADYLKSVGLIVIDNVWNEELIPWIDSIDRNIQILVTSREPIILEGGKLIAIDGLETSEAIDLLKIWGQGKYVPDQIELLCKKLGRLPLALKITGSQLAVSHQTPDTISSKLSQVVLESVGNNLPYAALVEQNLQSTKIKDRNSTYKTFQAFAALFSNQIPHKLMSIYWTFLHKTESELDISMAHLSAQKLIEVEDTHSFMYDVIFAISNYKCSEEEKLCGLQAYLAYIDAAIAENYYSGVSTIWLMRNTLLNVLRYAAYIKSYEFENILWSLVKNKYFDSKGYSDEWLKLLEDAVTLAENRADLHRAYYFCIKLGNGLAARKEELNTALIVYKRALEFAPNVVDDFPDACEAISLSLIGVTYARLGAVALADTKEAEGYFLEAEKCFLEALDKGADYPATLSQIYEHKAFLVAEKGEWAEARSLMEDSLYYADKISGAKNDLQLKYDRCFYAYIDLSEIEFQDNKKITALQHAEKALFFAEKSGKDDLIARAFYEMGYKSSEQGLLEKARFYLQKALEIYKTIDDYENELDVRELLQLVLTKLSPNYKPSDLDDYVWLDPDD